MYNMHVNKMQNAFQTLIMLDFSFHVSRKGGFLTVFFGFFYFGLLQSCGL